jgi:hypothetical protein
MANLEDNLCSASLCALMYPMYLCRVICALLEARSVRQRNVRDYNGEDVKQTAAERRRKNSARFDGRKFDFITKLSKALQLEY